MRSLHSLQISKPFNTLLESNMKQIHNTIYWIAASLIIFRLLMLKPKDPLENPYFLLLFTALSENERANNLQGLSWQDGANIFSRRISAVSSDSVLERRREYLLGGDAGDSLSEGNIGHEEAFLIPLFLSLLFIFTTLSSFSSFSRVLSSFFVIFSFTINASLLAINSTKISNMYDIINITCNINDTNSWLTSNILLHLQFVTDTILYRLYFYTDKSCWHSPTAFHLN